MLLRIGAFIVFVNEMWARERDRRMASAERLRIANNQLEGTLGQLQAAQQRLV